MTCHLCGKPLHTESRFVHIVPLDGSALCVMLVECDGEIVAYCAGCNESREAIEKRKENHE